MHWPLVANKCVNCVIHDVTTRLCTRAHIDVMASSAIQQAFCPTMRFAILCKLAAEHTDAVLSGIGSTWTATGEGDRSLVSDSLV